ncbi:MAG TPA: cytochrome b5-like heme/steroid binding domain-containing protein [Candidatus Absconditabacterales bacterium]|nr:cytochrome b5-like heme/steroid binding domain-containing protein [Candidatus Absconditabacterales bacterium]HMT27109.1 cytochrome b5-like heme/steroid binding domain-containing protein [Candidatus Absconditabacterales bacterium]
MKKTFLFFVCILCILFVSGCSSQRSYSTTNSSDKNLSGVVVSGSQIILTGYSLEIVALHSGSSSCWSVIDGKVYNFTDWVGKHPGGERAILKICGKDGSMMFHEKHGAGKRMEDIFAQYLIGELK